MPTTSGGQGFSANQASSRSSAPPGQQVPATGGCCASTRPHSRSQVSQRRSFSKRAWYASRGVLCVLPRSSVCTSCAVGIDLPDGPHRQDAPRHCVQESAQRRRPRRARAGTRGRRAREARGRQRLVDRGVVVDPRIALGDGAGVRGQPLGEAPGSTRLVSARAAAVVDEADDGAHAQRAQPRQPLVRPRPVGACPGRPGRCAPTGRGSAAC